MLSKHFFAIFMVFVYLVYFIYPMLLVKLNDVPPESGLLEIKAKILKVQEAAPNIIAESEDGRILNYRLAIPLYSVIRGEGRFPALTNLDEVQLARCDARIFGAYVDYFWPKQFRVWKVDCGKKG